MGNPNFVLDYGENRKVLNCLCRAYKPLSTFQARSQDFLGLVSFLRKIEITASPLDQRSGPTAEEGGGGGGGGNAPPGNFLKIWNDYLTCFPEINSLKV